jgi:nucleotide-binding universal stress UspA family protein
MAAPADYVVRQACGADLLVTGVNRGRLAGNDIGRVDTGDVLMRAGRPVLVVPAGVASLAARTVLVAWKDTREARRAVADALPFLKAAARVVVAEIVHGNAGPEAGAGAAGVAAWLHGHGVAAADVAAPANGDAAGQLEALAAREGADLVVAGAYGHSRLREWAFGGVTAGLLAHAGRCALLAH